MKRILAKYKIYIYILLGIIFLFSVGQIDQQIEFSNQELEHKIFNISNKKQMNINKVSNEYGIYIPKGYRIKNMNNSLLIEDNEAKMTVYFGTGESDSSKIIPLLNPNLKKEYEYSYVTTDNKSEYIGIWDNPIKNSTKDYLQIDLVSGDQIIAGVFPKEKIDKYASDIAYIFNSIKKIN